MKLTKRLSETRRNDTDAVTSLAGGFGKGKSHSTRESSKQSLGSDDEKGDIQQVADWTREYADSLDPLSDLSEAIDEFVRPESTYGWLK